MEFIHSTLSSLFFFTSINGAFHFGRIANVSVGWTKMRDWGTKKSIFSYTTFLCQATFNHSANTTPPTDDKCQRRTQSTGYWGHDSFLQEFTVKLWNYTAEKAEAVSEGRVVVKLWRSLSGEMQLRQHPSLGAPPSSHLCCEGSLPDLCGLWPAGLWHHSTDWSLHLSLNRCANILGLSDLPDL